GLPSKPVEKEDTRDLEELLEFIEGGSSGGGAGTQRSCKDAKKAAKKARQKQKRLEEKLKKEQEEAERQRLEEIANKTPEVTITVVNAPGASPVIPPVKPPAPPKGSPALVKKDNSGKVSVSGGNENVSSSVGEERPVPQMVTIKRVIESNGAEPTVTITLKGETPDKDKVLFTLVNGQ
ncbi:hypothetical protein J437_LFUL013177, partial [Ladona fulva]